MTGQPLTTFNAIFAARSRKRCAPDECDQREGCWVVNGSGISTSGNRRCLVCNGTVRSNRWISPEAAAREEGE